MHDFCFTIPYGLAILLGGLLGYLRKGSTTSLLGGVGAGLVMLLAATLSLRAFQRNSKSFAALFVEAAVSIALTVVMGQRFQATFKFMPAGIVATISGAMSIFLLYKIVTGGNHITKRQE
eukprot:TRINITY_DN231_c0_g1_i1.p1 TRINITY_DN231_c0_g1~~TRINITY_DN231_c0_g1_i1.p1  ORF type:complete len:120 (+),score=15.43 TRINITY_DN231_c0_g1_i1:168-527(+)